MPSAAEQHVAMELAMLRELECVPTATSTLLDFGCGQGAVVDAWRDQGFSMLGCDFEVPDHPHLSAIEEPYRLPYDDATFDVVLSDQVFEHVMDYEIAFAEIRRVLRPGGVAMHFFPARLRPVEPHVFVPLASVFAPRWWLRLWAHAGIRNNFQRGMSGDAVATENEIYLRTSTNYHTLREIEALAGRHFTTIRWVEQAMLEHAYGRARVLSPLARRTSMVSFVFRHFHTRVLATS